MLLPRSAYTGLCGFVLRLLRKIPEIGTIEKFDADLAAALSIVVAVDDAGASALALVFAAKNHQAAFFDEVPATQAGAVKAQRGSPSFLFPGSAGFFAADVDRYS